MFHVADAPVGAVGVETGVVAHLLAHLGGAFKPRGAFPQLVDFIVEEFAAHGIAVDGAAERETVDAVDRSVDQAGVGQYFHYREDAACSVHILDMVVGVGRHLAQHGCLAREGVDVGHGEVGAGLVGHCQQVEHGVGGATHGNVEGHGVEHCLAGGDAAWEHAEVAVAVVGVGVLHNLGGSLFEEFAAVDVCRHHSAVAGERETDGFVERVHGVGGEHA